MIGFVLITNNPLRLRIRLGARVSARQEKKKPNCKTLKQIHQIFKFFVLFAWKEEELKQKTKHKHTHRKKNADSLSSFSVKKRQESAALHVDVPRVSLRLHSGPSLNYSPPSSPSK